MASTRIVSPPTRSAQTPWAGRPAIPTRGEAVRAFTERRPVVLGALVFLALFILLRANPFQLYWTYIFSGLHLHEWWPVLFVGAVLLFPAAGWHHHRRSGLPLFFPMTAVLCAWLFALLLFGLLTEWSVDWPVWLCALASPLLLCAAAAIAAALNCFGETWRTRRNQSVIRRVRLTLQTNAFRDYLRGRLRWLGLRWRAPRWGSHHCLRIVEGHYEQTKENLLTNRGGAKLLPALVGACLRAVELMLAYLRLPYATPTPVWHGWRVAETAREMTTLALWAAELKGHRAPVNYDEVCLRLCYMRESLGRDYRAYVKFLAFVFLLRRPRRPGDAQATARSDEELRALVGRAVRRFEAASAVESKEDLAEICAHTWLAVAPTALPPQVVMDVWLAMRERQGADVFTTPRQPGQRDIVRAWARSQLAALYTDWRQRTPEGWRQPLSEKERRAHQQATQPPANRPADIWQGVDKETQSISSWPYLFVWMTPGVQRAAAARACLVVALYALALVAANPALPFNWGWNTIDRVADRRFARDYAAGETRAMASSDRTVALATSDGATFIDKHSRVAYTEGSVGPARDIARVPGAEEFVALGEDNSITRAFPAAWTGAAPWLPKPEEPYWRGGAGGQARAPKVLVNQLDESGWLVGLEGKGLARYRFGKLDDGRLYRTRSWQLGDLSDAPLAQARLTSGGVWAVLAGGGVRYAARDSLREDRGRRLDSPEIRQFDADYGGSYAAAVDVQGSLWLHEPEGRGWNGPHFGQAGAPLKSATDVTVARLVGETAWLGTSYGLFAYDMRERRIRLVVPGADVTAIAAGENARDVLVGASTGLFLARGPEGRYAAELLDDGRIDSLSLSPDAALGVYRRLHPKQPGDEVRALRAPFGRERRPETLVGVTGWKALKPETEMLAVERQGGRMLFVTGEGSFFYDPVTHSYQDTSKSIFSVPGQAPSERPLSVFGQVVVGRERVLSMADHTPQLFVPGEARWRALDPERYTQPKQLVDTTSDAFGLDGLGQLHRYSAHTPPTAYLTGTAHALESRPAAGMSLRGDLLPPSGGNNFWKVALLQGGAAVTYDSQTGAMAQTSPPSADAVEVRWSGARLLYLLGRGQIVNQEGTVLFSNGGLPFAPDRATMFAPGGDGDSVLVGGPDGHALRYRWRNASWERVGPGPVPARGDVETLQATSAGWLTQLTNKEAYLATEKVWLRLPQARRHAIGGANDQLWRLTADEVARTTLRRDQPPELWPGASFSTGRGMRKFTAEAAFAWQSDAKTAVFFTKDSRVGRYNVERDAWEETQIPNLKKPTRFLPFGGCVVVQDGDDGLMRVNGDLQAQLMSLLPQGGRPLAVRAQGETLRVAFTEGDRLVLRVWSNACKDRPADYQRGAVASAAAGFHPAGVVYAAAVGESAALLVDGYGHALIYDWLGGAWRLVRSAKPGETVYGVAPGARPEDTTLVLSGPQQTLVAVQLSAPALAKVLEPANLPEEMVRPGDGTLLEADDIVVTRQDGLTRYQIRVSDGWLFDTWREWRSRQGGFSEDFVQDVAISGTGRVWALQAGRLSSFDASTTDKGLMLRPGAETLDVGVDAATFNDVRRAPQVAQLGLAQPDEGGPPVTVNFGGLSLAWAKQADGSLGAHWQGVDAASALPVWCSPDDRLASQCVQDIATTADGKLLVSSEAGLLARDSATFAPHKIYPELRGARFVYADGGARVLLTVGDRVFAWQNGGPAPLSGDEAAVLDRVAAGPWVWQRTTRGAVSIAFQPTGRLRSWRQEEGGWRFEDDIVRAFARDGGLVLRTGDGLWTYDETRGRGEGVADPPGDESRVESPAVTIRYAAGMLTFRPFDGDARPAFERGRFFFDNTEQMCGVGDDLYTLVPRRGLFRRQAANPSLVTGAWPLPPEAGGGEGYLLEAVAGRVRLKSQSDGTVFEFTSDQPGQPWQRSANRVELVERPADPVVWRAADGRERRYAPHLPAGNGAKLGEWWHGDRFAWDVVYGVCADSGGVAVLTTARGPLAVMPGDGGFKTQEFWPQEGLTRCDTARVQGRRVGLVLWGEAGVAQHLFSQGDGRATLTEQSGDATLLARARLVVEFKEEGADGRHVGLSERWSAPGSAGGALESGLGERLSTAGLISQGQFSFDSARAATPLAARGGSGREWLVASACPDAPGSVCLVSLFITREARLTLRDFWPAPCRFTALRLEPGARGRPMGLCQPSPRQWQAYRLESAADRHEWIEVAPGATGETFRSGDRVRFDARTLNWTTSGPQFPWSESALEVRPLNYPLFASSAGPPDGLSLSFDRMNSLAMSPAGDKLAVGTDGGLFIWPYDRGGAQLLAVGQTGGSFTFALPGQQERFLLGLTRVRTDTGGNLLAKYGADGSGARFDWAGRVAASGLHDWEARLSLASAYRVGPDGNGLRARDRRYSESNDAWHVGTRELKEIVDFNPQGEPGVLWLATRRQGVFKIVTGRLEK